MRSVYRLAASLVFAVSPALGEQVPVSGSATTVSPVIALAAIDRRIAEGDAREQSLRADLVRTGERVVIAHSRVISHGRAYYRLTRAGLLPIGGGFGALVVHAMHVERARRRVASDLEEERRLHLRADDLSQSLESIARDRLDLTTQRQLVNAARVATDEEERRQAAFDRAFQTSTGGATDYVPVDDGLAASASANFAAARGRLLFPVAGRADVRAVRREGTDGPGLEVHAVAGSVVRATFTGRVAFADRYGPYGRIVILDHGNHYFTVSGNLDAVDVKTGESIGVGERIGTVGDEGAGPMLYFEVRHGAQTVAPGPWLGL